MALHLYPRKIRREYSDDMVALLEAQLRDEAAARVVGRAVVDLFVTVPNNHLEVHMSRRSTTPAVIALFAIGTVVGIIGGAIGLAVAAAAFAVAALTWKSLVLIATGLVLGASSRFHTT